MARTSSTGKKFDPGAVAEDVIPHTHNEYELGSTSLRWKKIWAVVIVATLITVTTLAATGINVVWLNATYLNASLDAYGHNITNLSWVDADIGNFTNITVSYSATIDAITPSGTTLDFNDSDLIDIDDIGQTTDEIGDIYHATNKKDYYGDGQEAEIYYDGSKLVIKVN